ncbi:PREDICTED: eppin-like [Galeopterus variegatus]|uniref:Eppin-like n=1 Tax=Galeopterus variegatus TaxID=482537 RepID=A0ABM0SG37_GALVR|nr:PREDICTED: eppin-like [Galeopterus variegatus]
MESSGFLCILVLFILFANVQGTSLNNWKCPRIREKCEFKERDMCTSNRECEDSKKCCVLSCGKKCLDLKKDICKMPKESGPCMAYFLRWWYSKENNTCSSFIYGGCQGNNNNFQTKSICQNTCKKTRSSS